MAAFSSTSATHTGTRTSTPRMIFQLRPLTDTMTKFSSCFLPLGSSTVVIFSFIYWAGRGVEGFHDIHGHQLIIASLFYSIIAFTANSKGLPLRGRFKYLGISEGIIGWLLMALFLVTLGRVMIG